jgi:hypothetical protein
MARDQWNKDELQELDRQIDLTEEQISNLRMTDVEASSLFKFSYPIEVAVCGIDMVPESMLIKPLPHWDDWSVESQAVHNISRSTLVSEGQDAKLVALRITALLKGRYVFSDAPEFDENWYLRLFSDVDVRPMFRIQDYDSLLLPCRKIASGFMGPDRVARLTRKMELVYPHTHRAGEDAMHMAAGVRMLVDREWADWLEQADYDDLLRSQGRDPEKERRRRK